MLQQLAKKRYGTLLATKKTIPEFRGSALVLQTSQDFEVILQGPAETGKTFAALWYLDCFLRAYKGSVGILVRKTRASVFSTVLRTYAKILHLRGNDAKPFGGKKPEWYDYPNGSILYIDGLDKAERLLSGEFDIIYGNQIEQFTLSDWETLTTRATGRAGNAPYSQVIGDCNPASQQHWVLSRKPARVLPSFHKDNPRLYSADGQPTEAGKRSLKILSQLTGVRRNRLYLGLWASAEGMVYADFNATTMVVDWFEPPKHWQRIVGIDFGYNNPFVAQWWAIDDYGVLWLYREIYFTNRLVEDHAKTIQRVEKWWFYDDDGNIITDSVGNAKPNPARERIEVYVADHDAEDRATLYRYGIHTIAAFKGVMLGIEAVQSRMQRNTIRFMRDTLVALDPELENTHKPTHTLEEIESYVWSKQVDDKPNKDVPIKLNDHGMDTKRYVVCYVDNIGYEIAKQDTIITFGDEDYAISDY